MVTKQKNIQETLAELLAKAPENGGVRNIIFWYDAEREFENDVQTFSFENTRIEVMGDSNAFRLKWEIEVNDLTSNFLLYCPCERMDNRENWLLDIEKYSMEFSTDRADYEMRRLGIEDPAVRPVIKKNLRFFENEKRVHKLLSYGIEEYTPEDLELGIISALAKLKVLDSNLLLATFISDYYAAGEEGLLEEIKKYANLKSFYQMIQMRFGYEKDVFDMDEWITMLFYTSFAQEYPESLPKEFEHLLLKKSNEAIVFLSDLIKDPTMHKLAAKLSGQVENRLNLLSLFEDAGSATLRACESFRLIDLFILQETAKAIALEDCDYETIMSDLRERRKTAWHSEFIHEYEALWHAVQVLVLVHNFGGDYKFNSTDEYVEKYTSKFSFCDYHYRKFYEFYDQVKDKELLLDLNTHVENTYVNGYVEPLSREWSELLDKDREVDSLVSHIQQSDFYAHHVKGYVKDSERVFVIISDAMRYEVARELQEELIKERRADIQISAMEGVVPSSTQYGMAALLPYETLEWKSGDLIIDGKSTAGSDNRQKLLQKVVPSAMAVSYDKLKHLKKQEYKDLFAGVKLAYIYHNAIDNSGHGGDVIRGSRIAIDEVKDLVRALVNHISATKILITADHGFLYQRSDLVEYDKVSKIQSDAILESERRYMISSEAVEEPALICKPLSSFIQTDSQLYTLVPKGTMRFKTQGSNGNFTHGGMTLQETIVPVIEYFDKRSDEFKAVKVDVQITSISRKITNRIAYLEFIQAEPISKRRLASNLKLYFVDEVGNRVSNEVMIIADLTSNEPNERGFREKFVLKDMKFDKSANYYLMIEDDDDTINPLRSKTKFQIDLMIANDFGF